MDTEYGQFGENALEPYDERKMLRLLDKGQQLLQEAEAALGAAMSLPAVHQADLRRKQTAIEAVVRRLMAGLEPLRACVRVVQEERRRQQSNVAQLQVGLAGLYNEEPTTVLTATVEKAQEELGRLEYLYVRLRELIRSLERLIDRSREARSNVIPPVAGSGYLPGPASAPGRTVATGPLGAVSGPSAGAGSEVIPPAPPVLRRGVPHDKPGIMLSGDPDGLDWRVAGARRQ